MRDVQRIKPMCEKLAESWEKVPDWRLGQLMVNICTAYRYTHNGTDPFFIEDAEFLDFISDCLEEED